MKMTLRRKIMLIYGLDACGLVFLVSSLAAGGSIVLLALGLGAVAVSMVLALCWNRCPCCDALLAGGVRARFCFRCGEKIDWDGKP